MILRNAPALGFTFAEARAARLLSASSPEAWAATQQRNAMIHTATDPVLRAQADEKARKALRDSLKKAMGMAATGHGPVGVFKRGTIRVSREGVSVGIPAHLVEEVSPEFREEVADAVPLNATASNTRHHNPKRKD
ncbi:hypothetical protein [Ralstonia phage RpY2]|uniref:Uncharacterized protein n=1 Tax=Ralstonia phage RpY2 TaxID=2880950 RepID=A0AC61TNK5_9CAUD|nr:hypothetical protein [Ralstonia phage RpY2]WAX26360.1 hypothetical protein [Ralstonia phage p2137]